MKIFSCFAIVLLANSCSSLMASEMGVCRTFLVEAAIGASTDPVTFNIERDYLLSDDNIGSVYSSLHSLKSGCLPLDINARAADELGITEEMPEYKDIDTGSMGGRVWIQFMYPSLGEYGSGLTSTITFYDHNGEPKSSSLVSSFHVWEGAQTVSSTMVDDKIVRCTQSLDFYSYNESGDINEELLEPIRSKCAISYEALDKSVSNGLTRKEDRAHGPAEGSLTGAGDACLSALASAKGVEDESSISAFRVFNTYPPVTGERKPKNVTINSVKTDTPKIVDCLRRPTFSFKTLVDEVLTQGGDATVYPLTAWKVPGGYIVFYIYKTYEVADGEGESVDISALVVDKSGAPQKIVHSVSSWYEYEGSIRIRDFHYDSGTYMTTEQVFDPSAVDKEGNVLDYDTGGKQKPIKVYDLEWPIPTTPAP